jgi:hypothetical protein
MKRLYSIFLLQLICFNCCAQNNLIPNSSFEDTLSCPLGIGNILSAASWSSYLETPDYFNFCNNNQAGIPSNLFGYQYAKDGNSYAGFYTYATSGQYREVIGAELNESLIVGEKYFISFYVCRAINPNPGLRINIATNNIGAKFSTNFFTYNSPILIDNISQVYTDVVISDTSNWVKISGSFYSDSAYSYVSFGNFFSDSATLFIPYDSLSSLAYYYIDDIRVSTDSIFVNRINEPAFRNENFKLFPNPFSKYFNLQYLNEDFSNGYCMIYNLLGEKVYETHLKCNQQEIDLGELSEGVFFCTILIDNARSLIS